ncbi:MAG: putative phosphoribosyl transferase [Thermoproteota archaeon]|nr:putative phosphoribosyl transferase [Thermoproteota archaeon]
MNKLKNVPSDNEKGSIRIPIDEIILEGNLLVPKGARGVVVFAHGSGSSRFSPRNRYVANVLQKTGLATLLMDLLTRDEEIIDEQTAQFRFNIELLSQRLTGVTRWLKEESPLKDLKVGFFGSSTGAAAALIAAAIQPADVKAVVSRGGRPDLAREHLLNVRAPTLLIVGGDDLQVIELNKEAMAQINVITKLEIIPGATHVFEEPGKLEVVAKLAAEWFIKYLN